MKKKTSFYLTIEASRMLKALATRLGMPQSAVLEMLIRDRAEKSRKNS